MSSRIKPLVQKEAGLGKKLKKKKKRKEKKKDCSHMEIKTVTDDSTKRQLKLYSQLSGRRLQIILPIHKEKAI